MSRSQADTGQPPGQVPHNQSNGDEECEENNRNSWGPGCSRLGPVPLSFPSQVPRGVVLGPKSVHTPPPFTEVAKISGCRDQGLDANIKDIDAGLVSDNGKLIPTKMHFETENRIKYTTYDEAECTRKVEENCIRKTVESYPLIHDRYFFGNDKSLPVRILRPTIRDQGRRIELTDHGMLHPEVDNVLGNHYFIVKEVRFPSPGRKRVTTRVIPFVLHSPPHHQDMTEKERLESTIRFGSSTSCMMLPVKVECELMKKGGTRTQFTVLCQNNLIVKEGFTGRAYNS